MQKMFSKEKDYKFELNLLTMSSFLMMFYIQIKLHLSLVEKFNDGNIMTLSFFIINLILLTFTYCLTIFTKNSNLSLLLYFTIYVFFNLFMGVFVFGSMLS